MALDAEATAAIWLPQKMFLELSPASVASFYSLTGIYKCIIEHIIVFVQFL